MVVKKHLEIIHLVRKTDLIFDYVVFAAACWVSVETIPHLLANVGITIEILVPCAITSVLVVTAISVTVGDTMNWFRQRRRNWPRPKWW